MPSSLRKVLVDSHVAAIMIAILLFLSLEGFYITAFQVLNRLVLFIQLAANHQTSNILQKLEMRDPGMLPATISSLVGALAIVFSAWLLSRWVYGVGPLRSLATYRDKLSRKSHA